MLLGSPVLNLKPHGTFSWPTSKSPFTPFVPLASLLHSSKLLRESLHHCYILLSSFLSCVAKGASKAAWFHTFLAKSCVVPSSQRQVVLPLLQSGVVPPSMDALPGFKCQRQSSSVDPFPTPPTISYTCQHSHIFPAFLGLLQNRPGEQGSSE